MGKRIIVIISCLFIFASGCTGPKDPVLTAEEIRKALSEITAEGSESEKIAYYEELLARDEFDESDYLALADLYQKENDAENQRRILRKLFKLNPTLENAGLLSQSIVILDFQNEDISEALNKLLSEMEEQEVSSLKALIFSDSWKRDFQEENGLIEMKLYGKSEEKIIQIRTSSFETEITLKKNTGEFYYFRMNEAGSISAKLQADDKGYNGIGEIRYYDENQNLYKEIHCTLKEDHCVDEIEIIYNGLTFIGKVNEDGTTAVSQTDSEKRQQNVVYAATSDGNSYLVINGEDAADFKLDLGFLRLPYYDEWVED